MYINPFTSHHRPQQFSSPLPKHLPVTPMDVNNEEVNNTMENIQDEDGGGFKSYEESILSMDCFKKHFAYLFAHQKRFTWTWPTSNVDLKNMFLTEEDVCKLYTFSKFRERIFQLTTHILFKTNQNIFIHWVSDVEDIIFYTFHSGIIDCDTDPTQFYIRTSYKFPHLKDSLRKWLEDDDHVLNDEVIAKTEIANAAFKTKQQNDIAILDQTKNEIETILDSMACTVDSTSFAEAGMTMIQKYLNACCDKRYYDHSYWMYNALIENGIANVGNIKLVINNANDSHMSDDNDTEIKENVIKLVKAEMPNDTKEEFISLMKKFVDCYINLCLNYPIYNVTYQDLFKSENLFPPEVLAVLENAVVALKNLDLLLPITKKYIQDHDMYTNKPLKQEDSKTWTHMAGDIHLKSSFREQLNLIQRDNKKRFNFDS